MTTNSHFWSQVDRSGGPKACWPWTGYIMYKGYGWLPKVIEGSTSRRTHRVAYELTFGPVPRDKYICHSCDVRACCNPAHLWVGSPADNNRDMLDKGRARRTGTKKRKLTEEVVRSIRREYVPGSKPTMDELAVKYGVSCGYVSRIVNNQVWTHVG